MNKNQPPKYDKKNSSYYHVTYFERGTTMTGYSCRLGFTEPTDKSVCLANYKLRLYQQGYLRKGEFYTTTGRIIDPVEAIEFYRNHTDELVLTCYPLFYAINYEKMTDEWFHRWIDDYYRDIKLGMKIGDLYKKYYTSRVRKQGNLYDLETPKYSNLANLNEYCNWLIKVKNEPPGRVEGFKQAYANKYFTNDKLDVGLIKQLAKKKQIEDNRKSYYRKTYDQDEK